MRSGSALIQAANRILQQQTQDGAIVMGALPSQQASITPYFANFAGLGLITAYRERHDARYLEAARRWVDWYAAHQNADGTINDYTGGPDAWKSTGDYDSTDSYAATYLELLLAIAGATREKEWLRTHYPSALHALAAIRLTLQPCGLTLAKPTYPVMYTMDNVETLRGLHAAAEIAGMVKDGVTASQTAAMAHRMETAIQRDLWSASLHYYRIGVQPDGFRHEGLTKWYPDVMANLMAIAWLLPTEPHRALFKRLKTQFHPTLPDVIHNEDDLEHLCWWGWAAKGVGDTALSAKIVGRLRGFDSALPEAINPGLLGHICRLLAR
jgi:hypothetical protein